ncbi:hypothetical protein AncyloWKF20_07500 [Ancylobacter sp. WKF20]|uniref:phage nozzle protein n=1 Tax=Ancylobacter sp. WKF20 TaxID=3039801 RepID=UPI0024343B68|nr:hypothetical protein [Ancylobacter sp. WKF20]WGD31654.1 hypothetical protein AncyloWKF20_07500 [Ancylobacter sp. WKF20]
MPVITGSIPNLINGVSQQAVAVRLASQAQAQENALSSVVEGLRKRPPAELVAVLSQAAVGDTFIHTINRDTAERYIVLADSGGIRIFDMEGREKVVNAPNGWGYLSSPSASQNLSMVTVADYTFIVNRSRTVAAAATRAPTRNPEALVWVKQGAYGMGYTVILNGSQAAANQVPNGGTTNDAPYVQTTHIASTLAAQINTNRPDFWAGQRGSLVHVLRRNDTADFSVDVADGIGGNGMKAFKGTVQRFSDLPERAVDGFVLQVTGDQTSKFDAYYVKFTEDGATRTGSWVETVKPGLQTSLDRNTMPHVLVREANGSFTFKPTDWSPNGCGDENTSPWPSFVGRTITDLFFHRNRLGFITDENVVMSRSGDFFNFFRQTATQLLDTDPIDIGVSHTKVSILRHAVPFDKELLLFSDQTQFVLSGPDVLTPKSVAAHVATEFECSPSARPVPVGKSVIFATPRGPHTSFREYFMDGDNAVYDAADISGHVPKYVPSGVFKLAASTAESILLALSSTEPQSIYVYQWLWSGNEKLQSAWHKWTFPDLAEIRAVEFIENYAYLVAVGQDGTTRLERMSVEPVREDGEAPFVYHLDSRIHSSAASITKVYDPTLRRTVVTLPYAPSAATRFVVEAANDGRARAGVVLPVTFLGGRSFSVPGDMTAVGAWIGSAYTMRYQLSPILVRQQAAGGGVMAIQSGRLQLRSISFTHERTGYYRVIVRPSGNRDTYTYVATGRVLGESIIGEPALADGTFRVPVAARNTDVDIVVENDTFLPCHILSAEWNGLFARRGRNTQ